MGKRANGEGTVYQRKDGRWVASILLENGKRKSIYCKTQQEAIKVARKVNHEKDQGMLISTEDQTLSTFLTTWLQDTAQPRLRDRTYLRYRELIELHVLPMLGKVKLQKLSPQHLQRLYNQKREEGYAPQTIKHIHRVLHRALNDALKWDLVAKNVCDAVDAPRVPKQEMKALTPEQAQQFLEAAKGSPLEALFVLALTTGMRRGELLALQWTDIDFVRGILQVRRTITRLPKRGFVVSEPKTTKSRRAIQLTELAIDALKRHRTKQHETRLKAGAAWQSQDWVFCTDVGTPLDPTTMLRSSFWPLLAKAGVPKIRFHDLRHSAASLLLSMGTHPKIVQELLGHSNISMTLDTYSHTIPSLQADAVSRLNTLLTQQETLQNPVAVTVAVKADQRRRTKKKNLGLA
jgi:integrase